MLVDVRKKFLVFVWMLLSVAVISAEFDESTIKMGPLLHFSGHVKESHTWSVSALYVLPATEHQPNLVFFDKGVKKVSFAHILGEKFGFQFIRYDMSISQGTKPKFIEYALPVEKIAHGFSVPAVGQSSNTLYHSCNGYQTEGDRERVGGITPVWAEINRRHREKPFNLQIGGGDQIYADGLINGSSCLSEPSIGDVHGVFALPKLQAWFEDRDNLNTSAFTKDMKKEVERFYFDQYVRHYNESQFKDAMASIPAINQPDDHDFYDGCGSYPCDLQNGPVLSGIRKVATWFAFVVQHQLTKTEFPKAMSSGGNKGFHYLKVIDDGRTAILGVDTRSERTADRIVTNESWNEMFQMLYELGPEVKHVLVMLAVPVVYASTKKVESALSMIDSTWTGHKLLSYLPGMLNRFGLPELGDDFRDGWGHGDHVAERDFVIMNLQKFASTTHKRVTLLGGDVHLGGAGKIYREECGLEDCSDFAITQIISSPVGNAPVGKKGAKAIGLKACIPQSLQNGCAMCVFSLCKEGSEDLAPYLLSQRNFVMMELDGESKLQVKWSAESTLGEAHTIYPLTIIPSLESK